jgi:hypothetical protein
MRILIAGEGIRCCFMLVVSAVSGRALALAAGEFTTAPVAANLPQGRF